MFVRVFARVLAGLVCLALLVGAVGFIGWTAYNAGLAQGAVQSGTQLAPSAGSPPYVAPYAFYPFGYGFGFLGCLAPLLLFFAIFALFRLVFWGGMWGRPRWRWDPHGPHTSGWFPPFAPEDVRSRWREKVEEWHRQMHESSDADIPREDKA